MHLIILNIQILRLKVTISNFSRLLMHKNSQALYGLILTLSVET